jgi:predicted ATPase
MELVGRSQQLLELQKAWAVTLSGRPRVVFVEGAEGVGKTALVNQFARAERSRKTDMGRPVIGRGQCISSRHQTGNLRPVWDATHDVLNKYDTLLYASGRALHSNLYDVASELASVIPLAGSASVAVKMARFLLDNEGRLEIPVERYTDLPELLIRDALLKTASLRPMLLHLDDLQYADPATISLLANLCEILWRQDEQCHLMVVLTVDMSVAATTGLVEKLKRHLQQYDSADNRVVFEIKLGGLNSSRVSKTVSLDTTGCRVGSQPLLEWLNRTSRGIPGRVRHLARGLRSDGLLELRGGEVYPSQTIDDGDIDEKLDVWLEERTHRSGIDDPELAHALIALGALAPEERTTVAHAAVQGPRFSSQLIAAISERDELAVIAIIRRLADEGIVEEVEGHPELTLFGGGVFDFTSADLWRVASQMLSEREKTILHGRIADFLHDRRIEMRAELDRIESEGASRTSPEAERQAVRQVKRQELIQAFDRSLAHHLTQARRPLEAAEFVTRAANRNLADNPRDIYYETALAYFAVDTTRTCEFLLGELVTADPSYDIQDVTRAEISLALTNARARARSGRFDLAEEYVEQAVDKARWLGDGMLSVRVLTRRMDILYWTGQSERAREVFEHLISTHLEDLEPLLLDELVDVFRVWEHPLVAGAKLDEARQRVERLDRRDLEEFLEEASFEILNRWRMKQWARGVVGDEQLANVTVDARISGLLPIWVEILLEGVEKEVYEEWERHAEYHLAPHDLDAIRDYGRDLVERSERMSDLARRAAQATNVSKIPKLDARSRVAWAKLFGTWRRRAGHLLRTWRSLVGATGDGNEVFEQLDALFNRGRLDESNYIDELETAITYADRHELTQDSIMLRAELLQQSGVDQQRAQRAMQTLERLTQDVPERALSIFSLNAELGRALTLGEHSRAESLAETVESTAGHFLSRVTLEDRIWLTAQVAHAWDMLGRAERAEPWFERQVQAIDRYRRLDDTPRVLGPAETYAAHTEQPIVTVVHRGSEALDFESLDVRSMLAEIEAHLDDGELTQAVDPMEMLLERVGQREVATPLRVHVYAMLAETYGKLAQQTLTSEESSEARSRFIRWALDAYDDAIGLAQTISDYRQCASLLREAVFLARHDEPTRFWELHDKLLEVTTELGDLAVLDAAFELGTDLLADARRHPRQTAVQPSRLGERLQQFVQRNLPLLESSNAGHLIERWTAELRRSDNQTPQSQTQTPS